MKLCLLSFLLLAIAGPRAAHALSAETYAQRPRLAVVIVIDQFRSDWLTRLEKKFLPAKNGGFRRLMSQGAWFPFARYDALQCMTCPGHATILTGAQPRTTGIAVNDFYDAGRGKDIYCAQDDEFGLSPRRLRAPTLGDELKLVSPQSKVVAIALKDRSAIMMGGRNPDLALWFDGKAGAWTSSKYYRQGKLPAWVEQRNAELQKSGLSPSPSGGSLLSSFAGTKLTFALALQALRAEGLGKAKDRTDVLALSLSNHDMHGHYVGPSDPGMEELTLLEDRELAAFLNALEKELGGLGQTVVAFTADHGVAPLAEVAQAQKFDYAVRIENVELQKKVEARLRQEFGNPGQENWVLAAKTFHLYLNRKLAEQKKIPVQSLERVAKSVLLQEPGAEAVITRTEVELNLLPPGEVGEQARRTYVVGQSGDVILVPRPYVYQKDEPYKANHMTGWSYDSNVPLAFLGRAFKPGVYAGGHVVDLAPTLAFVLGVLPPAMHEGRVLGEALR